MVELLWLLLPVAACSGYFAALKATGTKIFNKSKQNQDFKFNQKYIKGLNCILNEETDKAVDIFIDLFSVDHDTVETHMALGSLFRRRGEVERALRIHQNVIARPNLCPEQRLNGMIELGYDYLCAGVLDRAENIFRDIIKQYPQNITSLKYLLNIYHQQREWLSAIDVALLLQKYSTSRFDKNIAHYYCELAEQKNEYNNTNDAYLYNRLALKYQADNVRANLLLAILSIGNSQVKKGLKIYINLAETSPKYLDIILPLLINTYNQYYSDKNNEVLSFVENLSVKKPQILAIKEVVYLLLDNKGYDSTKLLLAKSITNSSKLRILHNLLELIGSQGFVDCNHFRIFYNSIENLLSEQKNYLCNNCGFTFRELLWACPSCKNWDTISHVDFSD